MIAFVSCHFSDLWILLSPLANVPFYSPGSQDSIEWWTMSVGGGRPNLWLFLLDKVRYWKSEKCWNILEFGQHEMSRMFINPFFCTKDEFLFEYPLFFNFWGNNDLEKTNIFKPIQEFIAKKIFWLLWNVNLSELFLIFLNLPCPLKTFTNWV